MCNVCSTLARATFMRVVVVDVPSNSADNLLLLLDFLYRSKASSVAVIGGICALCATNPRPNCSHKHMLFDPMGVPQLLFFSKLVWLFRKCPLRVRPEAGWGRREVLLKILYALLPHVFHERRTAVRCLTQQHDWIGLDWW